MAHDYDFGSQEKRSVARTYDLLEPADNNPDESLKRLTDIFAPLHTAAWVEEQSKLFGDPPYSLNVGVLAAMWMSKTLRIFIGYRDMKPAGYITGILYRPLTHQRTMFQVEDWYAPGDVMLQDGLFEFMQNATRFMGVDELVITIPPYKKDATIKINSAWRFDYSTTLSHYVKR